jgi:hypothetical protein
VTEKNPTSIFRSAHPILLTVAVIALVLPLIGYAYTGTFMRYSGDDFCYAAELFQRGFWRAQWDSYISVTNYSGNRYSLTLLSGLSGLLGPRSAGALPALAIVLWLGAVVFALRSHPRLRERSGLGLGLVLTSALLVFYTLYLAPELDQVLYWRSGMLPYLAPLIANTFLVGMVVRQMWPGRRSLLGLIGIAAVTLLAGGFSETGAALQVGYLGIGLIAYLLLCRCRSGRETGGSIPLVVALASSLLAMALLIASPINSIRQAQLQLPEPPALPALVAMSLQNAYLFVHATVKHAFIPHLVIVLAIAGLVALWLSKASPQEANPVRRLLLAGAVIPGAAFLLIVCCVAPSAYAQSSYPVARAMVMARYVTVVAAVIAGAEIGRAVVALWTPPTTLARWLPFLASLFIAISCFYPLQTVPGIVTDVPRYRKWSSFWDARDLAIRQARGRSQSDIAVVQLDHIISSVAELSPDPGYWYNNCAERYYDVGSISASLPGWDD